MPRRLWLAALAAAALVSCRSREHQPPPKVQPSLTLVAVGDILMHHDVKRAAAENGGFAQLWAEVTPLFRSADLVFGNLETPVAPIIGEPGLPYSFNAPAELPGALRQSGFAIVSTANNHAYDQGSRGVHETLSRLAVAGLPNVGSGRTKDSAAEPRVLERNGIRIAFLAFTDLFNRNHNDPKKGPWVNALDSEDALAAVRATRLQADAVVVSVHWGIEDRHDPTPRQREMAVQLFDAGTDLILGHHPHVLQPMETHTAGDRPVAVAFSMGNFISNQDRVYNPARMVPRRGDERDGAAVVARFTRGEDGRVLLERAGYVPLWTENNALEMARGEASRRDIRVVRLDLPERREPVHQLRRERIRAVMAPGQEAAW